MAGSKTKRVFVSHASCDQPTATAIVDLVCRAMPLDIEEVFCSSIPGLGLDGGDKIDDTILATLQSAEALVGLLTANSLKSLYVLFELGAGWGQNRLVIPLVWDQDFSSLSGPLAGQHALRGDTTEGLLSFVETLAQRLKLEARRPVIYLSAIEAALRAAPSEDDEQHVPSAASLVVLSRAGRETATLVLPAIDQARVAEIKEHVTTQTKRVKKQALPPPTAQGYEAVLAADSASRFNKNVTAYHSQLNKWENEALAVEYARSRWASLTLELRNMSAHDAREVEAVLFVPDGVTFLEPTDPSLKAPAPPEPPAEPFDVPMSMGSVPAMVGMGTLQATAVRIDRERLTAKAQTLGAWKRVALGPVVLRWADEPGEVDVEYEVAAAGMPEPVTGRIHVVPHLAQASSEGASRPGRDESRTIPADTWMRQEARFKNLPGKVDAEWSRALPSGATKWRVISKHTRSPEWAEGFVAEAALAGRYLVDVGWVESLDPSDPSALADAWLDVMLELTASSMDADIHTDGAEGESEAVWIEDVCGRSARACVLLASGRVPKGQRPNESY